jgi:hypothetical protein
MEQKIIASFSSYKVPSRNNRDGTFFIQFEAFS